MATRVLVAIDGSEEAWDALDHALEQFQGEAITALTVVDPMEGVYADMEGGYFTHETYEEAVAAGEDICEQAREQAAERGASETTTVEAVVEVGQPARAILAYAEEHDVDHIVMGSHGRSGVSRVLFGSVAETVTRRATVPVTIVR
jgi:nucleotide-binding universal stress UspA family protein